jgi:hypothetical protein
MTSPVVTAYTVPFPAGVVDVALTPGALLYAAYLTTEGSAPDAVLSIAVEDSNGVYRPLMVNSSPGGVYPRPLAIPIGLGGYFPLPPELQNLPANIQLQVQNAGAATSVSLVTSA